MKRICYIFIFLSVLGNFYEACGQSQGPNSPATAVSTSLANGKPWANPTNTFLADNSNASCILNYYPTCSGTNCYSTTGLVITNFGFSIPATAVISGIVVEFKRGAAGALANQVYDSSVMILQNALPLGIDHASSTAWTASSSAYYTYGSSTDLWGAGWTPIDINDVNFGVQLMVRNTNKSITPQVNVDHVRITVYYSFPAPLLFLGFKTTFGNNSVALDWETAEEQNVAYFEIEKSKDGNNFYPLGKIAAEDNNSSINHYHYIDQGLEDSIAYYRIKGVDKNQQSHYSTIQKVRFNISEKIIITTTDEGEYHLIRIEGVNSLKQVILLTMLGQQELHQGNIIKTELKGVLSLLIETEYGLVVKKIFL